MTIEIDQLGECIVAGGGAVVVLGFIDANECVGAEYEVRLRKLPGFVQKRR